MVDVTIISEGTENEKTIETDQTETPAPLLETAIELGAAVAIATNEANDAANSAETARVAAETAIASTDVLQAELIECRTMISTQADQILALQAELETMRQSIPPPSPESQQSQQDNVDVEKMPVSPEAQEAPAPEPAKPKRVKPRWI